MSRSEREKMAAGEWYKCVDDELERFRLAAREATYQHNSLPPHERADLAPKLASLFRSVGANCRIEPPFHCAYGFNVELGNNVFINVGGTILDSAPVRIGDNVQIGPNVHIYCAEHHTDPELRIAGLEIALEVNIGSGVWIGGGAIILAGVTIGDRAIVGAGSVVTRDVPAGATVVGNPARVVGAKRQDKPR